MYQTYYNFVNQIRNVANNNDAITDNTNAIPVIGGTNDSILSVVVENVIGKYSLMFAFNCLSVDVLQISTDDVAIGWAPLDVFILGIVSLVVWFISNGTPNVVDAIL